MSLRFSPNLAIHKKYEEAYKQKFVDEFENMGIVEVTVLSRQQFKGARFDNTTIHSYLKKFLTANTSIITDVPQLLTWTKDDQ